jgi:small GTP-binding protein
VDLVEYERVKFELAEILRSAEWRLRSERPSIQAPFTDLYARLAADRFNLVVVGRFSRGKSSLMNALLDTECLPVGIVPITSVITSVSYGSKERAVIEFQNSHLNLDLTLDELPDYVTQQGNPGNQRRVAVARIELPAELLRRGFHFIDTPGLGSAIVANTQTTTGFLPQADAFMLVTSFDSPLSHEELQTLRRIAPSPTCIFLVVNKQDLVSPAERAEVLTHIQDQARQVFDDVVPKMYSVSARDALESARRGEGYATSGVEALRDDLTRFLLTHKQTEFLFRMCERIGSALRQAPYSKEDVDRLRALRQSIFAGSSEAASRPTAAELKSTDATRAFAACQVCERLEQGLYDFLCQYQWELTTRHAKQVELARRGGLCAFHYWQFGTIASPTSICVGLSPVIDHWAARLQGLATTVDQTRRHSTWRDLQPGPSTCEVCRVHVSIESSAVRELAKRLKEADCISRAAESGLCLLHLDQVLSGIEPDRVAQQLLVDQAAALQRLSEDMRRYAVQRDGLRRELASEEDCSAERRALMMLGGHRNVFALRRPD